MISLQYSNNVYQDNIVNVCLDTNLDVIESGLAFTKTSQYPRKNFFFIIKKGDSSEILMPKINVLKAE